MTTPLVSFNHLSVSFAGERSRVRAVQEVSFTIQAGQTVGVVGESGCGKSVTAMALMGLLPPQTARIDGGEIRFADRDLLRLKARQMADLRGHQLAMIFQEPMSALNPVLTIGEQLCEPPIRHLGATPKAAWHQAIQLLREVGLARGDSLMTRYPHQLSRRHAAAGDDRHGAELSAQTADRRRTHHRARRDRAGADPTPAEGSGAGQPDGDDADYPRPGGDRADGRAGGGDVCRTNCGTRRHRGSATASSASLHAGADRLPTGAR